jgi:Protein of unknown function (DUF3108)
VRRRTFFISDFRLIFTALRQLRQKPCSWLQSLQDHRVIPLRPIILSLLLCMMARAETGVELLRPGEALTYRVGWGLLSHAGEIKISAETGSENGPRHLRIATTTATRGVVRVLYPFNGDASIFFDPATGRMLGGAASTIAGKNKTRASISLDHENGEAAYTDHLRAKRSSVVPIPPGPPPVDFITALIQGRAWAMSPGQTRDALVLFDDEFYPLQITAEREETIPTPSGPRKTVVLVPRMTGTPKGMFRRGGEVRVWVALDQDRLPLRFEVKLKVGTAYAVLTDYRPPS